MNFHIKSSNSTVGNQFTLKILHRCTLCGECIFGLHKTDRSLPGQHLTFGNGNRQVDSRGWARLWHSMALSWSPFVGAKSCCLNFAENIGSRQPSFLAKCYFSFPLHVSWMKTYCRGGFSAPLVCYRWLTQEGSFSRWMNNALRYSSRTLFIAHSNISQFSLLEQLL